MEMSAQRAHQENEATKPTVLAVEDVVLARLLVAAYLQESGFQVIEAGSADEAVRVLNAKTPVDVVFSDINIPGTVDGFGLAQWVQQNRPDVKVVLGTGVAGAAEKAAALGYAEAIIPKPYNRHELERRLRSVLAGKS
jgi:CheY-like chemotaxis protein